MPRFPIVTQNDQGDILYVQLSDNPIVATREFGHECLVDVDATGDVVGAEFIMIDDQFDLHRVPCSDRFERAVREYLASRTS